MTRVLYWNINNFSLNKIYDTSSAARRQRSRERRTHILTVVAQNPPDIFVVGEVYDRTPEVGFQGIPVNQTRRVGVACLRLLAKIRRRLGPAWCLVPPLKVGNYGRRESVAVFYNSATLRFTGPWAWCLPPLGLNQSTDPATLASGQLRSYAAAWRAGLPVPGTPFNAGFTDGLRPVQEWQGAAQWAFRDRYGGVINFPTVDDRAPYHVTFLDGAGRTVKIYAIHTSPASAPVAVGALSAIPGIAAPAANEVTVVIGDFNVDSFGFFVAAYNGLRAAGYEMALDPNFAGGPRAVREPYCMTHLIKPDLALPYTDNGVPRDPTHNVYPRLGYMGGTAIGGRRATDVGAIDNAFIRYVLPARRPARFDTTVVNTVVGTPYTGIRPPAAAANLTLNLANPTTLPNPVGVGYVPPGGGVIGPMARLFQTWPEFGVIYSTSDHLAVLVDV
ncbi:hypothetical protein [Conexibacter woesei]|uniref:Endonuclease/exonuclease/phosphatase n=1 Tax=Conexibacter woesei (strain DSM 14684 / CCUG 47730 / CIP 108061 / JCM 11494 / NBRC 100937 / ID131577) TaxID=469383 RepID=D3F8M9_CONWI|nr:hypothetical protein [Conexibacter woesei]ADB50993.1 hypothetical protein Cwoe_2572 [Conexibacter woesei DSM 14684]